MAFPVSPHAYFHPHLAPHIAHLRPYPLFVSALRAPTSPLTAVPLDMSAARHADVLFVKEKPDGENDLAAYCNREGIPHILFADFGRALGVVSAIVEGRTTAKQALDKGTAE